MINNKRVVRSTIGLFSATAGLLLHFLPDVAIGELLLSFTVINSPFPAPATAFFESSEYPQCFTSVRLTRAWTVTMDDESSLYSGQCP